MFMSLGFFSSLCKQTFSEWSNDKISMWSAALAYYTIFSLSPLLLVVIGIAGYVFGKDMVQTSIYSQLRGLIGDSGALLIESMVRNASKPSHGAIATIIGTITLLLGASGVFGQLKDALNYIWKVEPRPGVGFVKTIKDRFLNFSMVVVIAFLLLVSLIASAAISAVGAFLNNILPIPEILLEIINFIVSLGVITLLFALLYKTLPDVVLQWRNVFVGGAVTALLFTIGKTIIGVYLGHNSLSSTYGAAASMVIILVWIYYTSQIVFLGAEFTKVYTLKKEKSIQPNNLAISQDEKKRRNENKKEMKTKNLMDAAVAGYIQQRALQQEKKKK
jgi:membrane protein